jgi:predicted enzyme related to lactoylglutathione lyase
MSTTLGSLVHFSIPVTDLALGAKFYSELLGWKFQKMSEAYWMVEGGLGALSLERESANR